MASTSMSGATAKTFFIGPLKDKNVKNGNNQVALTIDDLESIDPWRPRALKAYGTAEIVKREGRFGPGNYLRVTPKISWSFGLKGASKVERWNRVRTVHV